MRFSVFGEVIGIDYSVSYGKAYFALERTTNFSLSAKECLKSSVLALLNSLLDTTDTSVMNIIEQDLMIF